MGMDYESAGRIFKALSDPNRLKIVDMLSCGEMCACRMLDYFHITQPTLSHHMKVLMDCGLVNCRKEGQWSHYSLNMEGCNKLIENTVKLFKSSGDCICKEINNEKCKC